MPAFLAQLVMQVCSVVSRTETEFGGAEGPQLPVSDRE